MAPAAGSLPVRSGSRTATRIGPLRAGEVVELERPKSKQVAMLSASSTAAC